jgi:hypothetical protein
MMTIQRLLGNLGRPGTQALPCPAYRPEPNAAYQARVGLAVESMKDHTTNEGWQLFTGLEAGGYELAGHNLATAGKDGSKRTLTDVRAILRHTDPGTVVVQDQREWDPTGRDFRDPNARFSNIGALAERPDIFKLTVLKDCHQRPDYHRASAEAMGCHAWVVYYHPLIVSHLAPYTRPRHLVRTYHSLDANDVPEYGTDDRKGGCLLSGAVSSAYPLRQRVLQHLGSLHYLTYLKHPGYHRKGCHTPEYLRTLARFRVALCTASRYGYALRKIMEATACGCVVITDLPEDEALPEIDGNLVRVLPDVPMRTLQNLITDCIEDYDPDRQEEYARRAQDYYDYRLVGRRLANDIERLRLSYGA